MADLTKKAIAEGLKELCHHKDFNKISVRDITEQCGLNRQTFYYHFQDKYELLDWIYYQEGFVYLASDVTFDNWHQHMEKLLTMMRENQIFYENTISASPQCFEDYLFQITCTLFEEAIRRLDGSLRLQEADVRLYSRFYSYGMCGIIRDWVRGGMKESPESLSLRIRKLANDSEKMASLRLLGQF